MKVFGVVSSFDILCGNATYSEAICDGLSADFQVSRIDVPRSLRRNIDKRLLSEMRQQISDCDFVNFQMELGLYGPDPDKASEVFCQLIASAKQYNVTMHRVESRPLNIKRFVYNAWKNGGLKRVIKSIPNYFVERKIYTAYQKIIRAVVKNDGSFIVHTYRERERILNISPKAKIDVYPILWPSAIPKVTNLQGSFECENLPVVGLFGMISKYKNYDVVLNGMKLLDFNLVIAGGTHPDSPDYGFTGNSYLKSLENQIIKNGFSNRVFIEAAPSDQRLIDLISAVDVVVVPYAETGQSGSGIASLAIQFSKKVIFSDTHLITQLIPFLDNAPKLFDVNSSIGFVSALKASLNNDVDVDFKDVDFSGLLKIYISRMEGLNCE